MRGTYVDGGKGLQVFNTVFYPRLDYDVPILGIDLLLFGGHKILVVLDHQPLSQDADYKAKYLDHLGAIKSKYPKLSETISNRYYEDTRWFSDYLLFGRLQSAEEITTELMPAFQEYMTSYTDMVREMQTKGQRAPLGPDYVKQRHQDYDVYNAERDPAGKLFQAYFGQEWSEEFLHKFLFDLTPQAAMAATAAMATTEKAKAPEPQQQQQIQQQKQQHQHQQPQIHQLGQLFRASLKAGASMSKAFTSTMTTILPERAG